MIFIKKNSTFQALCLDKTEFRSTQIRFKPLKTKKHQ